MDTCPPCPPSNEINRLRGNVVYIGKSAYTGIKMLYSRVTPAKSMKTKRFYFENPKNSGEPGLRAPPRSSYSWEGPGAINPMVDHPEVYSGISRFRAP